MRKTFSKVVVDLIKKHPGLSADDYAEMALGLGLYDSHSKWPIFSLRTTLMKQQRQGRMPEVMVKRVGGSLRFFPADHVEDGRSFEAVPKAAVYVFLPPEETKVVDALVEVGKFEGRSQAVLWLVQEGIRTRQEQLQQAQDVLSKIKDLKDSLPSIESLS